MEDNYDGVTIGDYVTELYFKTFLVESEAFNNTYRLQLDSTKSAQDAGVNNAGVTDDSNVYVIVNPGTVLIQTINADGEPEDVSQGFGLGIRQHEDVMLAYGYSRFTRHEATITDSDFLIIRLDVNDVIAHHTENREVKTRTESVRFKLYDVTGNENLFPASPAAMDIFNQKGPVKEEIGIDVVGGFYSYPIQASDPFSALTPIDNVPLWIQATNPANTSPDDFAEVKGRHYTTNRTYAVVIENLNGNPTEVYYKYDWHEY